MRIRGEEVTMERAPRELERCLYGDEKEEEEEGIPKLSEGETETKKKVYIYENMCM